MIVFWECCQFNLKITWISLQSENCTSSLYPNPQSLWGKKPLKWNVRRILMFYAERQNLEGMRKRRKKQVWCAFFQSLWHANSGFPTHPCITPLVSAPHVLCSPQLKHLCKFKETLLNFLFLDMFLNEKVNWISEGWSDAVKQVWESLWSKFI